MQTVHGGDVLCYGPAGGKLACKDEKEDYIEGEEYLISFICRYGICLS